MPYIEMAQEADLPRVCELFLERGNDFDFTDFPPPDKDSIRDTVYKNWRKAPCFLLKDGTETIGFAGLTLDTFGWNAHTPFLCDYMIYIQQPYRDYNIAKLLYTAIMEFAAFHGIAIHLHYIAVDRQDARLRLMRRLGFKHTGFLVSRGHHGR